MLDVQGYSGQNAGAPGRCVEALDESPMPPMIDADGVLANAIFGIKETWKFLEIPETFGRAKPTEEEFFRDSE